MLREWQITTIEGGGTMQSRPLVLFIDDDKHLTRTMRDFLEHEGFEVATAATAEAGLKLLDKRSPDIIVLDISMPGMGGIGFLKRISDSKGTPRHPVLVLTARAVMKEFFDSVAVDAFLSKPCSELDLIRNIKTVIEARQPHATPDTRRRVLIGEDDEQAHVGYRRALHAKGFEVHFANSGPDVLEQAVAVQPDVIVMKELLPNMNGSVVARLIKSMPNTRGIPVVIHDETRQDAPSDYASQGTDLFIFSARPQALVAAIQRVVAT